MRLSRDPSDPGYVTWCEVPGARAARVFLAGAERHNVVTADEEKRMAVVYKLDAEGHYVVDEAKGEIVLETFYGDVCIQLPPTQEP
jgi:hypothetical protein